MMRRISTLALIGSFLFLSGIWGSSDLVAQGRFRPMNVDIETDWVNSAFGYRKAKVIVSTADLKPATRDYDFTIVGRSQYVQRTMMVVTRPLLLESGKTTVEGEIYLPNSLNRVNGASETIHVELDGNLRYDYLYDYAVAQSYSTYYDSATMPTILIVSSAVGSNVSQRFTKTRASRAAASLRGSQMSIDETKFPSLQHLYTSYTDIQYSTNAVTANPTATDLMASRSVHATTPGNFPRSWQGLTSCEIIMIPASDLKALEKDAEQIAALRKWLAAGGNLIVFECAADLADANEIRSLIDGTESRAAEFRNPWHLPNDQLLKMKEFVVHREQANQYYYGNQPQPQQVFKTKDEIRKGLLESNEIPPGELVDRVEKNGNEFAFYEYVLGRVYVVGSDMRNWNKSQWSGLINSTMTAKHTIGERLGEGTASHPSTSMSIEGVGKPPVNGFMVLITMFVLLVGPISYYVLKRQRRLQLLFSLIPLISMSACLGLLLFALLSDGFQNRGRIRSFTTIDHARQRAVSFSRHSHYQGVQPKPYEFEADEVVVVGKAWNSPTSTYQHRGEKLRVLGGDIRPRLPHQLTSAKSHTAALGLRLLDGQDKTKPTVLNELATPVKMALFGTEEGLFLVENVAPGGSAIGELVGEMNGKTGAFSKSSAKLKSAAQKISPSVEDKFLQLGAYNSPYNYYSANNSKEGLFDSDRQFNLVIRNRINEFVNEPGQYLAILEEYSEVATPQENIDYKNKLHIIHGKW